LQESALKIYCSDAVRRYIGLLAQASRQHPDLALGLSPRGALMLLLAARGRAMLHTRDYILPDDVQVMAPFVVNHRLIIRPEAKLRKLTVGAILEGIIASVPVPQV
jgi:MoxR-like ATPase